MQIIHSTLDVVIYMSPGCLSIYGLMLCLMYAWRIVWTNSRSVDNFGRHGVYVMSFNAIYYMLFCIGWRNNYSLSQRQFTRSDTRIGHHGNRRWRQIQVQIHVYSAERPSDNAARPPSAQTITHGRCYDITSSRVNNVIKACLRTN